MQSKQKSNLLAICVVSLFAIVAIISCGGKTKVPEVSGNSDESFEDFYERFHKDTAFQLDRISFPLEGKPIYADETTIENATFHFKEKGWKLLHHVDWDTVSQFTRRFESVGLGIVNEYICSPEYFCMSRRFYQTSKGWELIYYADMNFRPDLRE